MTLTIRNRCLSVRGVVGVALGVTGVMLASSVLGKSDGRGAAAESGPAKPPVPEIQSLLLEPATLTLADARDGRQVLVWGVTADGRKFDLTGSATFKSESPNLTVGADHYVSGTAAGEGTLAIDAAGKHATLPVKVISADQPPVRFVKDVMPTLAAVGCNAGTCHGSAKGKNGFKLSLRGYDPEYDYAALVNDLQGRRVNRVEPGKSLMLLKPTGEVPHEGKQLFTTDSRLYHTIEQWIQQGVKYDPDPSTARPNKLEVLPPQIDLDLPGRSQRMIVLAKYPDGSTRDVTREAVMSVTNIEVGQVAANELTALRRGESAVLVRYEGNYATVNVSVMGDRTGFAWTAMPEYNYIDHHINAKLQKQKILPSGECTDAEFLRRAFLDLTGVVPTAAQARTFIENPAPSQEKRAKLINGLVGNDDYVAFWSNKWADLLQCNQKALGEKGVWEFREWLRQAVAQNVPYDQFVHDLITAQGSSVNNPPVNYYRALKDKNDAGELTPNKMTEDVSQTFLGVRFNCNKCHDHPFEKWTQNQYYEFGAFFARVSFKPGAREGEEIVYSDYLDKEVKHPKTDMVMAPEVPYGTEPDMSHARVRQEAFASWLTSRDNPLFARSYVNRVWSYFFGRGIIDPVDDIRASNPPVNPELLDALTQDFVKSGFDTQHLVRTIMSSRTYQLSVASNDWNADDKINFSHFIPRRLSAEQMMDAVAIATGTQTKVPGLPADLRSVYLADGLGENGSEFLKLFGRPKRESACECERTSNVSLAHALNLVNGPIISGAVTETGNGLQKLVERQKDNRKIVEEVYLMILNRLPAESEVANVDLGTDPKQRLETTQDLAWALLNSPAFLFNR